MKTIKIISSLAVLLLGAGVAMAGDGDGDGDGADDEVEVAAVAAVAGPNRSTVLHVAPSEAPAGEELRLIAVVDAAWTEAELVAHYRPLGSGASYRPAAFERSSAGGYYATIPAQDVARPGIEYYIAGVTTDGEAAVHFAAVDHPHSVRVEPTQSDRWAEKERIRLDGYVSSVALDVFGQNFGNRFDDVDGHDDRYVRGALEFRHRLLLSRLYSISLGFGFMEGDTPPGDLASDLAEPKGGRFGYGGAMLRLHESVWFRGTVGIGVDRDGFIAGSSGAITFGKPWRSNVELGAEYLENLGPTAWLRLQWDSVPPFLMGATVMKTDLPAATLTGGALIRWDVEYPLSQRLKVRGSLSFGSRDGPGNFGGGLGSELSF